MSGQSSSAGDKKTQSRIAAALQAILQRLPLISHIVMLILALYGPTQFQYQVAFVFFTLHIVLVSSQFRTAYGVIRCLYYIRQHYQTNWWNYYLEHSKNAHPSALETTHTPKTLPHLIVIPSYKESVATLTQTLSILASHPIAKATYKICLAMEEREAGSRAKGESLRAQFQDSFLDISVSVHPSGLPGEYLLSTPEKRERMMFVPPIIFDRNQADVPGITRITDIIGIGGIYPSSLVKIPTSAYSVSVGLAVQIGFWDTGADAIGEDMHMFCKSLLDMRGHLHVETIYSPASQCNVIGPRPQFGTQSKWQRFMGDSRARWTQGVRHLWGSLDTAYVWSRFLTGDFGVSPQREAEHRLARLEMRKHIQQDRINNLDATDRYASDSDYNVNDYFSRSKTTRVRLQVRTEEASEMDMYRKKGGSHLPGRHVSRLPAWAHSPGVMDTESSASSFISGDTSPPSPIDTQSDYSFSSVGDDGSPTNID
ncbi:13966_t:CDS:2, partial [Acaulospora colombiana]